MRLAHRIHTPVLRFAMRQKFAVIALAAALVVTVFGFIAPNLGSEFVPRLSEGALAINVVRLAGTDLAESIRYNTQMERAVLAAFPDEVRHVWSRIGTAEVATDPMGMELTDLFITLRPRSQWTKASTQSQLAELVEKELRSLPGQRLAMTQPIENQSRCNPLCLINVQMQGETVHEANGTGTLRCVVPGSCHGRLHERRRRSRGRLGSNEGRREAGRRPAQLCGPRLVRRAWNT
jgi:multidrug efflux pump subunit AcrB